MSFTFNGINCESYGMYVEKYPSRPFPKRKVTSYNILGKSGDLIVDHGGYENVIQEYEVFVKGSGSTFQNALSAIAKWLLSNSPAPGYAQLRDDYDPSVYREARVVGGEVFLNSLNRFGRATLQFDCKPFRYPYPAESIALPLNTVVTVPSNQLIGNKPLITIKNINYAQNEKIQLQWRIAGLGSWNNLTILPGYDKSTVYVDFELKTAYVVDNLLKVSIPITPPVTGNWSLGGGMEIRMDSDYASSIITATINTRRYSL